MRENLQGNRMDINNIRIAVIGLGYVGLPLMVEFAKKYPTLGFDINSERISQLRDGIDLTLEVSKAELGEAKFDEFSHNPSELKKSNIYIVTVPTPIDEKKNPDLKPLKMACETVGNYLKENDIVIFESTVYPGATEEYCAPILESKSGLKLNESFFLGYSPERINPGDKKHRITEIVKVTSGSTRKIAQIVDTLYSSIIPAGTYLANSIKVAEAAKVIENTQRDLNIALINELCIIFNKMNIDTEEVLEAAGTKWNFLPFRPGLVGGHCISVDPYYLTYKSEQLGYHPEVILAGRKINDGMGKFVSERIILDMLRKGIDIPLSKILIMGFSFKENCPDLRNTKVIDIFNCLKQYTPDIDVYNPWVNVDEASREFGINITTKPHRKSYDTVVVTVAHSKFKEMGINIIREFAKQNHVIFDVKYLFPKSENLSRL